MRALDLFSGISALSAANAAVGSPLTIKAFAEVDDAASAVLAHHHPEIENLGDVKNVDWGKYRGEVDLVAGGSPCQSFSVAGERGGLADPRGNLALYYLRVVREVRPRWFLYENVPGLLTSNYGRDFATFINEVGQLGYRYAWRVLDSQHFGIPQRRRRLWVVGHHRDFRGPASVLFEPESRSGDPAPRPTPWQRAAAGASGSAHGRDRERRVIPFRQRAFGEWQKAEVAGTITASAARKLEHVVATFDARGNGSGDVTGTLTGDHQSRITDYTQLALEKRDGRWTVRRFTPRECLRLQGFPDDWLDGVQWRGRPLSDTAAYRLIGNSWPVPVAAWLVNRIVWVDEMLRWAEAEQRREAA
jgi:DNA (cytosine-5)-methyltransferase 1